jgi:hypothetical protein
MKSKNKQEELHQTKKLCTEKATINEIKKQSMDGKKYLQTIYLIRG